jgi:hypothetical protein
MSLNLDDYKEVKRQKVLVYGPPKAGKTVAVGKLAEAGFTLHWFDLEGGVKSLLNPDMLKVEARKNIKIYNIPDNMALPIGYDAIRQLFRGGDKKFCYEHGVNNCPVCAKKPEAAWSDVINLAKFTDKDILVVDSLTQLSDSAINKLTLKDRQKDDEYKLTFNDFGNQGMYMKEILTKVQTANINICMISHQIDAEKSDSKEKIVPVAGTRNFSVTAAKYFDEVIYMQVMNKKHAVYSATTWSNTHITGGRSGVKLEEGEGKGLKDIFNSATK